MKSEFDIGTVKPVCLRCGEDRRKRLSPLVDPNQGYQDFLGNWHRGGAETEFYVCRKRKDCRARQKEQRPAKMLAEAPPFQPDLSITVEKYGDAVYTDRPWKGPK